MRLDGKVALITGASRGIGAEVARQMSDQGASVYIASHDPEEMMAAVCVQCKERNPRGEAHYGLFDFREEGAPERLANAASSVMRRIDILVNNAAIRVRRPYGEYTAEDFDSMIAINLRAPFFLGQAVAPIMRAAGSGRIINIASQMGSIAEQNLSIYGLTKAALIHLTMSMAFELAPFNIMVNAVSPGPTMTEYNEERTTQNPDYFAHKLSFLRTGRYSRPDEIAETVVFLASTTATNIQGHNLVVDGGYLIQ